MKKHILCFGDSNTHGYCADSADCADGGIRFNESERWPRRLQSLLGEDYLVIEEGLSGRTTCFDDPIHEGLSGLDYIYPCLKSHETVDLLIIMLGTNDIYNYPALTPETIGDGITKLITMAKNSQWGRDFKALRILVMAPIALKRAAPNGRVLVYNKYRAEEGEALSKLYPSVYKKIAAETGCDFLNAAEFAAPCDADGLHMSAEDQITLGKAVAAWVKENL